MIVWICGPSGVGKTTIGRALYNHLKPTTPNLFLLDGDEFRNAMGNDLGFAPDDRRRNGHRIARLCRLLESQDIKVICTAATLHPEVQEFNRKVLRGYCEVVVQASFETLLKRDKKDIYRRALQGGLKDVIGVDIDFSPPASPHLVLNNDQDRTCFNDLVLAIMQHLDV